MFLKTTDRDGSTPAAAGRGTVQVSLRELADNPSFATLEAAVNYAKHRALPEPAL